MRARHTPHAGSPSTRIGLVAMVLALAAGLSGVRLVGAPATNAARATSQDAPARSVAHRDTTAAATTAGRYITYDEAAPIVRAFAASLPASLRAKTPAQLAAAWPRWIARHDREIRARLVRGDEDSLVNLWLYGTRFTTLPRVTPEDVEQAQPALTLDQILFGRLDALVAAAAAPGDDERLQFARQVIATHGLDLDTAAGRGAAHEYLQGILQRKLADERRYASAVHTAAERDDLSIYATLYRDRGLSSDTSVQVQFSVDRALAALAAAGHLRAGAIHDVAIIGPGLDFTDKADGYDFYPVQTLQPFAVIDSLTRLGLAAKTGVSVTTLDLNARVNDHLRQAAARAARGDAYTLMLPLDADAQRHAWLPALIGYWRAFGDRIGAEGAPVQPPASAGPVDVRTLLVRPAVVLSITPDDVDIVTERLDHLAPDRQFDLILATNVLLYYDRFDQALALANVAAMLRPGGGFLTNYLVHPAVPMDTAASFTTRIGFDRQGDRDTMFWYSRH